jgi:hypothetical protein
MTRVWQFPFHRTMPLYLQLLQRIWRAADVLDAPAHTKSA